jgi:hypothetical protein
MMQSTYVSISILFIVFQRIITMFIPYKESCSSAHFAFITQFSDVMSNIICIICGYIFLTMAYLYHDPSRDGFHLSIFRDSLNGAFILNIILIRDILGNPIHWSTDSDHIEDLFEEPTLKFIQGHEVNVIYVDDADRNRIVDRYKHKCRKLHFYRLPNPSKSSQCTVCHWTGPLEAYPVNTIRYSQHSFSYYS